MKKLLTLLSIFSTSILTIAQGPWDNDLKITFSTDGTTFGTSTFFQDSSDVPSVAMMDDGTLIAAFQWFPGTTDGSVAVKTSTDNGQSWTTPTLANFINQPPGLYKPVDPAIVNIGGGQMRMYFSIGTSMITDSTLDVYSAVSTDGINYTFESSTAAYSDSVEIIEPAVGLINGTWHCLHAIGAPWEGATHATSTDGLTFTQAAHVNSDTAHTWIGNFITEGATSKFYGSSDAIWWASTSDGIAWSPYMATNVFGGHNPAITKMSDSTYVMIYVQKNAPPLSTEELLIDMDIFPNPAQDVITVNCDLPIQSIEIIDLNGRTVLTTNKTTCSIIDLNSGTYFVKIKTINDSQVFKKIIKL